MKKKKFTKFCIVYSIVLYTLVAINVIAQYWCFREPMPSGVITAISGGFIIELYCTMAIQKSNNKYKTENEGETV